MPNTSIPRPAHPRFWHTVTPRTLLPPCAPPRTGTPPPLPSPSRPSDFGHGFSLSTHIVPAAFPRSTPYIPVFPPPPADETKDERAARAKKFEAELRALRERHERGELDRIERNENVLWNCLNRYVREGVEAGAGRKGLTLFCAHANGMHKETFEPMIRRLLDLGEKDTSYCIDEIWSFEAVQHGDSALINRDKPGALFDWIDQTRDMLNFFLHFLPEDVSSVPLPAYLEHVSARTTERRKTQGFSSRRLITIGHSFGGCTLTLASYHIPTIFTGIVLLDPVIAPAPPSMDRGNALHNYVVNSFSRRISWPSREEAYKHLKPSPFFRSWDDEVLRVYLQYGTTDAPGGGIRLKCRGYDEAYVFADRFCSYEAFSVLENIDPRIPMKWIVPPAKPSIAERDDVAQARVWRRPVNTSNVVIPQAGHLLVQDSPDQVAAALHDCLPSLGSGVLRSRL